MEFFYHRHSAKKCIKYSFDSRDHLKPVRRLPDLWSRRTLAHPLWNNSIKNITSQPWSDTTCPHTTSHSTLSRSFLLKGQDKILKAMLQGLRQIMVESSHCLDWVVSKGMSQIWRKSEVGSHKWRTLNTRLFSDTSQHASFSTRNASGRMIRSDLVWYWNKLKTKPAYREKSLRDYLCGGFRSSLMDLDTCIHIYMYVYLLRWRLCKGIVWKGMRNICVWIWKYKKIWIGKYRCLWTG